MRINQFIAQAGGFSRRQADDFIKSGQVRVNDGLAQIGQSIGPKDKIYLNNRLLNLQNTQVIMLNKPVGFVCSRRGQGSRTIYELIPHNLAQLKSVGRLDKDSSGLIILTNDGQLANQLTHPKYKKIKVYELKINKSISEEHRQELLSGVKLDDGLSKFRNCTINSEFELTIEIYEGRNRQIRRTLQKLGYTVVTLKRIQFGPYKLGNLANGQYKHL